MDERPLDEEEIRIQVEAIRNNPNLPSPPPSPRPPDLHTGYNTKQKVFAIQKFIESFQYNYTGQPFVRMQRNRGMHHISSCAKQIIRAGLPIQCVEAVFIGCLLTAGITEVDRVPLSFKSKHDSNTYRHIVLAVRYEGKWGALGISRRKALMNKDIRFESLSDMVDDYGRSYAKCGHRMVGVYFGLPFSHDVYSDMPVKWKVLKIKVFAQDQGTMAAEINRFGAVMMKMLDYFRREGSLPPASGRREKLPNFRNGGTKRRSLSLSLKKDAPPGPRSRETLCASTSSMSLDYDDGNDTDDGD